MELYLYKFSKRGNSTAKPDETDSRILVNGQAREPMDVLTPEIRMIETETFASPPHRYNYAYIPQFDRYYFATGWTWDGGGAWRCQFTCDVLASYKTEILNSTQYVVRSSTNKDENIIDSYYPAKSTMTSSKVTADSPFTGIPSQGRYIVSMINKDPSSVGGGASYYSFSNANFREFCSNVLSSVGESAMNMDNLDDLTLATSKIFYNPFQYITGAMWFPITFIEGTSVKTPIPFGWWEIAGTAAALGDTPTFSASVSFNIPKHPKTESVGRYLNSGFFSAYTLYFFPWGAIPLDANSLIDASSITCNIFVDLISGVGKLEILAGNKTITVLKTQVGVPVGISGIVQSTDTSAKSLLGIAASFASGVLGLDTLQPKDTVYGVGRGGKTSSFEVEGDNTITKMFKGVADAVSGVSAVPATLGSTGSFVDFYENKPFLQAQFYDVVDTDNDDLGSPLCKKVQLSTQSGGFVMCQNADISLRATTSEISSVVNFLNSGAFLT